MTLKVTDNQYGWLSKRQLSFLFIVLPVALPLTKSEIALQADFKLPVAVQVTLNRPSSSVRVLPGTSSPSPNVSSQEYFGSGYASAEQFNTSPALNGPLDGLTFTDFGQSDKQLTPSKL